MRLSGGPSRTGIIDVHKFNINQKSCVRPDKAGNIVILGLEYNSRDTTRATVTEYNQKARPDVILNSIVI